MVSVIKGFHCSHLHVLCWSICDLWSNQIKQSRPLLRADQGIIVTSELRKSTNRKVHSCLNFEPLKIKWSKKIWFRSQMLQQATYKCMTTPRNTRWTFYLTLKYKMMKFSFKTDVVWSHILNGLGMDFLSTHRKAAGVLSKHPTRIQNGAEAKKLVIWSFLTFVWEMISLVPRPHLARISLPVSRAGKCSRYWKRSALGLVLGLGPRLEDDQAGSLVLKSSETVKNLLWKKLILWQGNN